MSQIPSICRSSRLASAIGGDGGLFKIDPSRRVRVRLLCFGFSLTNLSGRLEVQLRVPNGFCDNFCPLDSMLYNTELNYRVIPSKWDF